VVAKIKEQLLESHEFHDVWEETWYWGDDQEPQSSKMIAARNKVGDYIGDKDMANFLAKHGIAAELNCDDHDVCSIGWSERGQKYFGWSHRAIIGFGIGDMIFEEDFECDDDTPFVKHGRRRIETKEDAKLAAKNFAEYVG
jgi:hypothetical protein